MRGISSAIKSADRILRITWSGALIISVSMAVWQLEKVFVKYFIDEHRHGGPQYEYINFPQITVCNAQSPIAGLQNPHLMWKQYVNGGDKNLWRFKEENDTGLYDQMDSNLLSLEMPPRYAENLPIGNDITEGLESLIPYCVYYDWSRNQMKIYGYGGVWKATFYRCVTLQPSPANKTERVRGMDAIFYLNYTADIGARRYRASILVEKAAASKKGGHTSG